MLTVATDVLIATDIFKIVSPIHTNGFFLYSLKTSVKRRFSNVFRTYRRTYMKRVNKMVSMMIKYSFHCVCLTRFKALSGSASTHTVGSFSSNL